MKQLFSNRYTITGQTRTLCKPVGYSTGQEILYTKKFTGHGLFAVRAFNVEHDFSFVQEWICKQYALQNKPGVQSIGQWMQTYTMMLQSDFMQPLLLLQNDHPVCLADVYYGQLHELSLQMDMQQQDYVIELLTAPLKKKQQEIIPLLIQTCLHYIYSFTEVSRIISEPNVLDIPLNAAMQQSGFRFIQQLELSYKTANLYESGKAQFFKQFG